MSDLRKAVIRLAHENPGMRADLLPLLKEAAADIGQDEADAILERELEPLKRGLWKPPYNLALNFALMGANLWVFTILPMRWSKTGYRTIDGQEGIVIHPIWTSVSQGGTIGPKDMSGFSHLTPDIANKIVKAIKTRKTIPETVGMELKAIQQKFGIKIPAGVSTKIINQSVKVAKRRWGVNRLRVKDRFVPLDGSKPRDLGSWD